MSIQSYTYVDFSHLSASPADVDSATPNDVVDLESPYNSDDDKPPAKPSPPKKARSSSSKLPPEPSQTTLTFRSFSYTLQNKNKNSIVYYCSHRRGSGCEAKLRVPLEGYSCMPNLYMAQGPGRGPALSAVCSEEWRQDRGAG